MDISKWAFKNRNLVYFLVMVLLIGGILSCYQMSKLEDPEIKVKLAMVVTTYPGASAHQVELEVTDVLEKSIRSMGNIDNVESYSYNDLSLIQIELTTITPDEEVEQCWDMLRRKVSDACALLPDGASTPIVKDDFGNVYGMFYALTGDGLSDRELSDYAELIKREISDMEDVDRVELYGKRPECINISLLQDRMANLGVKPAEVLATLNGQNKTTYSGYYDNGDNRIRVTVSDKFKTVKDIGNMLIQGHDDDQLRMRDIARIEKGYEEPTRNELFFDSERAQGILIAASGKSDIVKVGAAVEKKLAQLKESRLPAGVECHKVFYQPERVGASLGTFVINLIESVIIVVVILMLAMGFKSGVIIGISLIVTVFGSFLFLQTAGGTARRIRTCNGDAGRQRHRHRRRNTGGSESGKEPHGSHDSHWPPNSNTSVGSHPDSYYRFSAHFHVTGHSRRLYPRPFHCAGSLSTVELGVGIDPCSPNGRPQAAPRNRSQHYRKTRVQRPYIRTLAHCPVFRFGTPLEFCSGNDYFVRAFHFRLRIYAPGVLPGHGI